MGLVDPDDEDNLLRIREALAKDLSPSIFVRTTHIHLRGAIDYAKLSVKHRLMMKGLCAVLRRKPPQERSADTQLILDSYGQSVNLIDFDTLAPIQAWLAKE